MTNYRAGRYARPLSFAIGALLLLAAWTPAWATDFPKEFRGLWITGKSCTEPTAFGLFASDFGVSGGLNLQNGKFNVFTFGSDVIVEASPDHVISRIPGKEGEDNRFIRELKNGHLFSHVAHTPDKVTEGFRCDTVRSSDPAVQMMVRMLHNLDVFVRAYSDIADNCPATGDTKPCAAKIVALLDVNGDGKVSPAEVTTFLRHYLPALSLFGDDKDKTVAGYRSVKVDVGEIAATEGATAVFGPFLTNIVFSNLDFDGNGFLGTDEIALALKQEGVPQGAGGALKLVGAMRSEGQEAITGLGGELGGMLGGGK